LLLSASKRLGTTVILLAFGISTAFARSKTDEQTFVKLTNDWAEALKHADMPFLKGFYTKEFTAGLMTGASHHAPKIWQCSPPAI
jgi:hypothetical protein